MKHIEMTLKFDNGCEISAEDSVEINQTVRSWVEDMVQFLHCNCGNIHEYAIRYQPDFTDSEARVTINVKINEEADE